MRLINSNVPKGKRPMGRPRKSSKERRGKDRARGELARFGTMAGDMFDSEI